MPDENDRFWGEMASKLRRAMKLHPLCPEESETEYKAAERRPLPDGDLDAIVHSIVSGRDDWKEAQGEETWSDGTDAADIEDQVLQVNRNLGDEDPEVDERVEEHRRKVLGKDGEANKDSSGLDDGEEPQGKSG